MFGIFEKKPPPLKMLVASVFGDDALLMDNKKKNQDFVTIAVMALAIAYRDIAKWESESRAESIVKRTNHDVLAFEIALFTVCQALCVLEDLEDDSRESEDEEFEEFEDSDLDSGDLDEGYDCIKDAMHFMKSLAEKDYGKLDEYFVNRVKRYSSDAKNACEAFAFNLTCINGAQNFDHLTEKVQLDLQTQLYMIPFAIAHRKVIVPAFIDSVNQLLSMEAE